MIYRTESNKSAAPSDFTTYELTKCH